MKEHHSRNLYFGFVSLFVFFFSQLCQPNVRWKKNKKKPRLRNETEWRRRVLQTLLCSLFHPIQSFRKEKRKATNQKERNRKKGNTTERTKSARNDSRRNVPDTRRCCFEERDVCVRGLPASPLFFSFFFLFSRSRTKRDRNAFRRDKRRTDNAFVRRKFSQEPYSSFLASFLQILFFAVTLNVIFRSYIPH